jgi:L-ascorbate metabolism protein UlaG (beta-lactamase superfamily)
LELTRYGHSAFRIDHGDNHILIDPFLSGNPSWDGGWEGPAQGVTHVLITHGHSDHIGDALAILRKTGAMLVSNYEIYQYLVGQGADPGKVNPGNHGGTVDCGGFTTTFVNAVHSSSLGVEGGGNIYLGDPAGLVLHFPDAPTLYHMGDTDIFSDMALINELHQPAVALVPIGDRFTMGGAVAALACTRYFNFSRIIPCHYGTFPVIDQTAASFIEAMGEKASSVLVPPIGKAVPL